MADTLKLDRRTQISVIAQRLFFEKGFSATGLREIANEAGIEAASVYSHYSSKNEILLSIAEATAEAFEQAIRPIIVSEIPIPQKLTAMITRHMEVIAEHQQSCAVFFMEWKHLEEPSRSTFAQRRSRYQDQFQQLIQQGIDDGTFQLLDGKVTTRIVLSALNWSYTWYRSEDGMPPEEIGKNISNIILHGISKKK